MKKKNLDKEIGRLERHLLKTLKEGLELKENSYVRLDRRQVEIGLVTKEGGRMFASDITLYSRDEGMEMNYGGAGSFTPRDEAQTYRTIHASKVIEKWDWVETVVTIWTDAFDTLIRSINEQETK